jgi:membrane associated rhomboid family serine protease
MYPIGDDNQDITTPAIVTWALIALNVAVFLYELSLGDAAQRFITAWGAVPRHLLAGHDLETLVTSMFIHGGFAHIIGNMLYLKVFGDNIEDNMGHGRFLLFYFITGLVASIIFALLNPKSSIPSVGASGAISGVLGAYIVLYRTNRVSVLWGFGVFHVPAWAMIGFWALQQFVATYASIATTGETDGSGVAYAAHAGGFVAGVVLAFIMGRRGAGRGGR